MAPKWNFSEASKIFSLPFPDLLHQAQTIHRKYFNPTEIQISTLLSIKTGSCPENCSYCPQSAHYNTGLQKKPLTTLDKVIASAKRAQQAGSTRFCMGAAYGADPVTKTWRRYAK